MQTSRIFASTDVIVNNRVLLAGTFVLFTAFDLPDLIVETFVFLAGLSLQIFEIVAESKAHGFSAWYNYLVFHRHLNLADSPPLFVIFTQPLSYRETVDLYHFKTGQYENDI